MAKDGPDTPAGAPAPVEPSAALRSAHVADAYRAHRAMLCRYVARTFGSGPPEPEEVAQAAFARYAALSDHSEVRNVPAFLTQCARNVALDARRRTGVEAEYVRDAEAVAGSLADISFASDRLLEGRERLAAVEAVIRVMEEKRRTVLLLHTLEDLSAAEIGRRMGLSRTHIVQLFADAIAQCSKAAKSFDGDEE